MLPTRMFFLAVLLVTGCTMTAHQVDVVSLAKPCRITHRPLPRVIICPVSPSPIAVPELPPVKVWPPLAHDQHLALVWDVFLTVYLPLWDADMQRLYVCPSCLLSLPASTLPAPCTRPECAV